MADIVAVGDCEREFAAAAAADGVALHRARMPWLNQRGHLGLPPEAGPVRKVLADIFAALGGDPLVQAAKKVRALPGDFVHLPSGTLIEVDESQHFTSFRRVTLDLYPADASLGFDIDEYRLLCDQWSARSDRYRASKAAVGFGAGGRQRQRAYHDALRTSSPPLWGIPRWSVCPLRTATGKPATSASDRDWRG